MNEIPFDVTVIRIVSAICMLSLASIFDMWKREVHDILWIAFAFEAGLLIFLEPNTYEFLLTLGISLIIAPIAILFWRIGFFGGADAFCIIVLSSLAPLLTVRSARFFIYFPPALWGRLLLELCLLPSVLPCLPPQLAIWEPIRVL